MKCPAHNYHTVFLNMLCANLIMLTLVSCILVFNRPSGMLSGAAGVDVLESGRQQPVIRQAGYTATSRPVAMAAVPRTGYFGPASARVSLLCAQAKNVIPDMNSLLQMSF